MRWRRWPDPGSRSLDRRNLALAAKAKRRAAPEALRRRAVAKDQLADGSRCLGTLQGLRDRGPRLVAEGDAKARLREQISRPRRVVSARGNQQAAIGFFDVADGDLDRAARETPARLDSGDLAPSGELLADLVRQRPRCQLLPSVCTEGA
jgi:hypothetical protein